jgi:hypothetical protein
MKALIFLAIVTRSPDIELSFGQVTACGDNGMILGHGVLRRCVRPIINRGSATQCILV